MAYTNDSFIIITSSKLINLILLITISMLIIVIYSDISSIYVSTSFSPTNFVSSLQDDDIHFEVLEPETLRYTFRARLAQNFGTHFNSSLTHIGLVIVEPNDACNELHSKLELRNNIGLIERGGCSFLAKCIEAERSGMTAILIYDDNTDNDELMIDMVDDNTKRNCSIPAAFLLGKDGYMIRRSLDAHGLNRAVINIPINLTVITQKKKQPPWIVW